MDLKESIIKVAKLQGIDKEIYQLNLRKDEEIPAKIDELKGLIKEKEESFKSFKDKVNKLELEKKNKEGELAQKEENLKKAKAQLYQLKSNKEYQVKLKEIASIEADISCAEEEMIKAMDLIDQEKSQIGKEKESVDAEINTLKTNIKELENQLKEIEQNLKVLQSKRGQWIEGVDPKILNQYEGLLKKRGGLAMVPVKNNNCAACHMTVTHQTVNEIKMYQSLVLCESCVRILYIPEDFEL